METQKLPYLDVIENKNLKSKPKAILIIKLAKLFSIINPELIGLYLKEITNKGAIVPLEYQSEYQSLKSTISPKEAQKSKNVFVQNLCIDIENAIQQIPVGLDVAKNILVLAEKKLRKAWWRSGKKVVWILLMDAWAKADRSYAIQILGNHLTVNYPLIIKQWEKEKQISEEEWGLLSKLAITPSALNKILFELIEDNQFPQLPDNLIGNLFSAIKSDIIKMIKESQEDELNETFEKFLKFMSLVIETKKEKSFNHFISDLYSSISKNDSFYKDFTYLPYNMIEKIVSLWAERTINPEDTLPLILKQTPDFLKDFVQSVWYSLLADKTNEVGLYYNQLMNVAKSKFESELWFLVKLILNDKYSIAEKFASNSEDKEKLLPILRRVFTAFSPDKAQTMLNIPNEDDDPIGHFILLPTVEERIEFLKRNLNKSSFYTMWSKPNVSNALEFSNFKNIYNYYSRNTKKEDQFKWILKIKGYYYYHQSDVDYRLLHALVAWDNKNPQEASEFMAKMYKQMIPEGYEITTDLIRNSIFERCRSVLCANTKVLDDFLSWIKRTIVDSGHRYTENYQTYILRFPYRSLLYQTILAAEKISTLSASRCDEILVSAIKKLSAASKTTNVTRNDGTTISLAYDCKQLIIYAGKLYASDKGLEALNQKFDFSSEVLEYWQTGMIEGSMKRVTNAVLNELAEQMVVNEKVEETETIDVS